MDGSLIYGYYLGPNYRIGQVIKSPFPSSIRKEDNKPSFSTRRYGDHIIWKDFAIESPLGYGPIGFVSLMENGISKEESKRIIYDVILKGKAWKKQERTIEEQFEYVSSIKTKLDFRFSLLEPEHYQYYKRLSVQPETLHLYKMCSLKEIRKDDNVFWKEKPGGIGFYKMIGNGNKAYMPFNKNYYPRLPKVIHQGIDVLEGYEELPRKGKLLILKKSLKDVIFLRQARYFSASPSGETSFNILKKFAWELSERFEYIVAWGDPDPAGMIFANNVKKLIPKAKTAHSIIAKDATDIFLETNNYFHINRIIDKALMS